MVVAGAGGGLAITVHAIFALGAIGWFCLVVWSSRDHFIRFAALVVATLIVSPYMMAYDFLIVIWVLMMLAYRHRFNQLHKTVFRLMVLLPVLSVLMAQIGIPGSAVVTVLLAIWLWKVRDTRTPQIQNRK